ncbi:MoaD/ThiS family protein [Polynucleobacter sp. MWH-Braz-FAM2G]|uniref:MoaD/ThiS family protein n=1 Tax=Polynucleobacter sp. MWH-Braz-FAM2G TaxID=1855883 RepID=UPI001BFE7B7D|nr:MoaD/ThiS family protein [Polynucleobacter sp. MWH-Braz-FAM2G]QWD90946.1 MoaD/ThiS family protein [Polynucleobacter sp. MWH-Braz-FAM2G]
MKITLKLFASLASYLPPNKKNGIEADIDVADTCTIGDIILLYKIPSKSAHLVMVNGVYIKPAERDQYILKPNDALAICPPVAGG